MLIDILIPTYNRAKDTIENLTILQEQIASGNLYNQVQVIISDNCSPDSTQEDIASFCTNKEEQLQIQYYKTTENIGLEPNAVNVLSKATSPYVIFLGDDDFLAEGYLEFCIEHIQNTENLGCIVPGLLSLFADGSEVDGRPASFKFETYPAGYQTTWTHSHLGHQMSGVLCSRENLLEDYLANEKCRNPYLFLYFVANRMMSYASIYAPGFKTKVNAFNLKDWGYNKVGLLDEVYKCYYALEKQMSNEQLANLLLRFTVVHSYRISFKPSNFFRLFGQYFYLIKITPKLKGFKWGLAKIFIKDYIKSFF